MHTDHTRFPFLWGPFSHSCALPQKQQQQQQQQQQQRQKRKNTLNPIYVAKYTHWNMVRLPVPSPLKKTKSFPTFLMEAVNFKKLHLSICIIFFQSLLSDFLNCFFFFFCGEWREVVTVIFNVSHSPVPLHKKFLSTIANDSMDHRLQHSFWWQHGPQPTAWTSVAAYTTNTNMAPGSSIDHGH